MSNRFARCFALLLCALPLTAAAQSICRPGTVCAAVPIEFIGQHPTIRMQIEGHPVMLWLDTGSQAGLVLKQQVLDQLPKVHYTGAVRRRLDLAGHEHRSREFTLDNVFLGRYPLGKVTGLVFHKWGLVGSSGDGIPAAEQAARQRRDGVLGLGALDGYQLLIDFPNARLVIFRDPADIDGYALDSPAWVTLPFTHDRAGVNFEARVNGRRNDLVIDTGATASIFRLRSLGSRLHVRSCDIHFDKASYCLALYAPALVIGGVDFGPLKFYVYDYRDPPMDGLLGYNFLIRHRIYLNFTRHLLGIESAQ